MQIATLENVLNTLTRAKYKHEIDSALNALKVYDLESLTQIKNSNQDLLNEVALLFRNKIFDIVLNNGDICDSQYLYLYALFASSTISVDCRFDVFINTYNQCFLQDGLSELENLMLLELGALCSILGGSPKDGIGKYIKGISHIGMHLDAVVCASNFIRNEFPRMGIDMEYFLECMRDLLALEYYTSVSFVRRRSILNWQIHCFWNVSTFFNNKSWLELYPLWRELFYFHLNSSAGFEGMDHALYMQFFIYHMCGNSFEHQHQWRDFCKDIDIVASGVYKEFASKNGLINDQKIETQKIVIGILRDRLVENSPYKVEYSFLKNLLKNPEFCKKFEIKIYLMGLIEKSSDSPSAKKSYQDLGIEIVDVVSECNKDGFYNSHLEKSLALFRAIKSDGVRVLLSPNNGYGISDFIFALRSAPIQVFWSHGNFVFDVPNIDYRITHICGNQTELKKEGFDFVGIPVVMDKIFYDPVVDSRLIELERSKYPRDKMILGTIGRLVKIDSLDYLSMIVELMEKYPNTIYLACGIGNVEEIKKKLKKILGKSYEGFIDRFYFCGYVNSDIYGHIIDFWPDSFPMEQGESRIEYVSKGGLSLVLVKNPSLVKKEWITMAVSVEDYRQKAMHLIELGDKDRRELVSNILNGLKTHNKNREDLGVSSMIEFLNSAL